MGKTINFQRIFQHEKKPYICIIFRKENYTGICYVVNKVCSRGVYDFQNHLMRKTYHRMDYPIQLHIEHMEKDIYEHYIEDIVSFWPDIISAKLSQQAMKEKKGYIPDIHH